MKCSILNTALERRWNWLRKGLCLRRFEFGKSDRCWEKTIRTSLGVTADSTEEDFERSTFSNEIVESRVLDKLAQKLHLKFLSNQSKNFDYSTLRYTANYLLLIEIELAIQKYQEW